MGDFQHLEFIFENCTQSLFHICFYICYILLLLYFYEKITNFLKQIRKGISSDSVFSGSDSTTNNNSSQGSANAPPTTASNAISANLKTKQRNSLTTSSSACSTFDMYYEVEILLQDFLEPNSKYFIPHFDSLRSALVISLRTRTQNQKDEDDTEAEDAEFYIEAFRDFANSVHSKLKNDIFPRMIRAEEVTNFFKNLPEQERIQLLTKVAKKKSEDFHNILYTEEEFNEELICERDLMFTFQLIHDNSSIWKPIFLVDDSDDTRASAYYSTQSFKVDANLQDECILLKYMGYLPFNVDDCAKMFLNGSYHRKSDSAITSIKFVELHLPNKEEEIQKEFLNRRVASSTTHTDIKFGPFLTKRDMVSSVSLRYIPHLEEYLQVSKPTIHESCPERKKRIRAKFLTGVSFQGIASNETRFTMVTYFQLGGWLKKLGKGMFKLARPRCQSMIRSYTKLITEAIEEKKQLVDYLAAPLEDTLGNPQIFEWNKESTTPQELKTHYKISSNKNLFDLKPKKDSSKLPQITVRL